MIRSTGWTVREILGHDFEPALAAWCTWPPRTRWGRWRLSEDHKALEFRLRKPAGEVYYVLLSHCRTRHGALLWVTHLAGKPWITDADLGQFVRALVDLLGRLERIEEYSERRRRGKFWPCLRAGQWPPSLTALGFRR